jgi:hypothetical protein
LQDNAKSIVFFLAFARKIHACAWGCGIDNGSHGARTSVNSTIIISGTLIDYDDRFLHLQNANILTLSILGVSIGFNDDTKISRAQVKDCYVSIDKILFINTL